MQIKIGTNDYFSCNKFKIACNDIILKNVYINSSKRIRQQKLLKQYDTKNNKRRYIECQSNGYS